MSKEDDTTIIGLDFGSHTASIAVWSKDKNTVEVIADDMGIRSIPTAVAYRLLGDNDVEIITGQSAITQQAKNAKSTFDDVRAYLLNTDVTSVTVPAIDKEVPVEELATHFFRNIHNQIKQQMGRVVRECVVSLPSSLESSEEEVIKKRILSSAQAGGIRIKSFIKDSVASLLAYDFDDISMGSAGGKTLVVDLGWSKCELTIYNVSGGLFVPVATKKLERTSGSAFVKALVEHCAKDFTRKTKCPFPEYSSNNKAVIRLKMECENAMKSLSIGSEAMIDIDSLYEGMDYSSKISRARYEDLLTTPLMQLKMAAKELAESNGGKVEDIKFVCLAGGPSPMPKVQSTFTAMFPTATFTKAHFEMFEAQCIGAALHGKYLFQLGLLANAPVTSPVGKCLSESISLADAKGATPTLVLLPNALLPAVVHLPATLTEGSEQGFFQVLVGKTPVAEIAFKGEAEGGSDYIIELTVSSSMEINIEVMQKATKIIVASLTVPGK